MTNNTFQLRGSILQKLYYFFIALFFVSSFSFQSCDVAKGMVAQDPLSIEQNEIIKTDAISLMKKGAKSYSSMLPEINNFKTTVNDHIDYEKAKGEKNSQTVKMWELMMDPSSNLLGGFLSRWETEDKLNATFIKEAAKVVSTNFDKIIKLEKKKKKP